MGTWHGGRRRLRPAVVVNVDLAVDRLDHAVTRRPIKVGAPSVS
jgi:hypothetical protein